MVERAQDVMDPGRDVKEWYQAFWELTGFGFRRNSEVKREGGQSTPRMGDPLGSCSRVPKNKTVREW
ncbi:hypothetical protein DVH24_034165 [Malus domestica]|uniref:Uncharacterized protein n=1 Tax=Malus domestica TaxID=3750 RepID=A0A498I5F0_MALDO|nr:hypothetical protein DVH24_034165 [Malus domestica]